MIATSFNQLLTKLQTDQQRKVEQLEHITRQLHSMVSEVQRWRCHQAQTTIEQGHLTPNQLRAGESG